MNKGKKLVVTEVYFRTLFENTEGIKVYEDFIKKPCPEYLDSKGKPIDELSTMLDYLMFIAIKSEQRSVLNSFMQACGLDNSTRSILISFRLGQRHPLFGGKYTSGVISTRSLVPSIKRGLSQTEARIEAVNYLETNNHNSLIVVDNDVGNLFGTLDNKVESLYLKKEKKI